MIFANMNIERYNEALASGAPTPGGGGASALAASLGTALGSMVCNLTAGKKKYAEYEGEIQSILAELESMQLKFQQLMDDDAFAFEPLAKAYSIPKDAPGREETMERCLRAAAVPPMEMLRLACRGIHIHRRLEDIGSSLAVSDVATGVVLLWAAMYGAAMNVRVNTRLMKDREYAEKLNAEAEMLMNEHWQLADGVYERIWERLG